MSAICQALEQAGVRCVFGIPGTQNVEFFEALRRSRLRTVLTASELGAAFMAGAYARASGGVGVLVTIAGPGFTYALPGLAEARADSAAILHITGLPASEPGRRFQLQAIDQAAIAAPIVKAVISVTELSQVGAAAREAIALARSGEPGPVLLQVADALLSAGRDGSDVPAPANGGDGDALRDAVSAFAAARRPVLLVGQGVAQSGALLGKVAAARRVPVLTTPSGRGVIPEDDPLSLGFDPLRHDLAAVNALIEASDLILALGCKLGHNGTAGFGLTLPHDRLVHVDPSLDVPGANYATRISACAAAERFFAATAELPGNASEWSDADLAGWRGRIRAARPLALPEPSVGAARGSAEDFFVGLRRGLARDAILVTDSGMHQVLARRYYDVFAPGGLLLPSDFQSMGFGIPAAIGAALGAPGRRVAAVVGDGGLRMTGMELTTAVRERLPIVFFVFSDGRLNQIRLQQINEFGHSHAVDLAPLDLERFAAATGAAFARLHDDPTAVLAAAAGNGPTLVEVPVSDSAAVRVARAGGVIRESVRRALGPRLLSWLKRWR